MSLRAIIVAIAACAGLAACGENVGQQAVGGAAVGAGVAALTSNNLAQGAAVGAAGNIAYCKLNPGRCG